MYPTIHILIFKIDTFSLFFLFAIASAAFLMRYELKRNHYPSCLFFELIVVALIFGIVGSKLYYCFHNWTYVVANPFSDLFCISGSGWFGAFVLGGLSIVLFLKIKKLPVLKILDMNILVVPLGQTIGRFGCFISGDGCYGIPSDLPWAMSFPNGLVPTHTKVHPTPLYEMIIGICVFLLLWKLRKKETPRGSKLALYLILASLGRFVVEFYRLNPKILLGFTAPQIIAFLSIILGIFILLSEKLRYKVEVAR